MCQQGVSRSLTNAALFFARVETNNFYSFRPLEGSLAAWHDNSNKQSTLMTLTVSSFDGNDANCFHYLTLLSVSAGNWKNLQYADPEMPQPSPTRKASAASYFDKPLIYHICAFQSFPFFQNMEGLKNRGIPGMALKIKQQTNDKYRHAVKSVEPGLNAKQINICGCIAGVCITAPPASPKTGLCQNQDMGLRVSENQKNQTV